MSGVFWLSGPGGSRWPGGLEGSVSRFEFEAGLNRDTRLCLHIRNDAYRWQDNPLLGDGTPLIATFGTDKATVTFGLTIHQVCGTDMLTVPAFGPAAAMGTAPKWRVFGGRTYPEIAAAMARDYGLTHQTTPETNVRREQTAQVGETDAAFLTRLAQEIGWEFWIEDQKLHFHRPDYAERPAARLVRGSNLFAFHPSERSHMRAADVAVRTFLLASKDYVELTMSDRTFTRTVLGPALLGRGREQVFIAAQDRNLALAYARGRFEYGQRNQVTARFRCDGDPALMPAKLVQVDGYGSRWDGVYRIREVRHNVTGALYTCEGSLYRNAGGQVGEYVTATQAAVNHTAPSSGRPLARVKVVNLATGAVTEEEAH